MKKVSLNVRSAPQRKVESFPGSDYKIPETEEKLAAFLLWNILISPFKRVPEKLLDILFLMLPLRFTVYVIIRSNCGDAWLVRTRPFFVLKEAKKYKGEGDCLIKKPLNLVSIRKAIEEAEKEGGIAPSERKAIEKLKELVY